MSTTATKPASRRWSAAALGVHGLRHAAQLAKRGVQISLAVLIVLLIAVSGTGLFATWNLYRSAEDRYIGVVAPLRALTRDVLFQMEQEETGVRGYVLTSDRRSLAPYFRGRDNVLADLRRITKLTRTHPTLAHRLSEVRFEVTALHGFYDRLITFVADGTLGRKQAEREVLDGDRLATRFRNTAALMQKDIDAFTQQTRHQQHKTFVRTMAVLATGGFFALVVAAVLLREVPERLRLLYAAQEEHRRRAEQGANAARALAHVGDAVVLVDDEGIIGLWNAAAEQLFGISADIATGLRAVVVIPDYERLADAAERGERFVPVRIGTSERWLDPALSTFEGGRVLAVRDATAGYELERARGDFVATASHELRTPLTSVYGGVQTLIQRGEELDSGQRSQLLHVIEQESKQLVQIVDQLLVSARLDRGALDMYTGDHDLAALAHSVVAAARLRAPSDVDLAIDVPTSTVPVHCDEALLRQALVNLLENALKYSHKGGRVTVRVREDEGRALAEVRDQGPGIPASDQERIFEKFYRLDAAMTHGVGGSGLGLYIAREIVTRMGGTLTLRSSVGSGSTFTISLPLAERESRRRTA